MSDTIIPGNRTTRDGRYLLWFLFSIPALYLLAGTFWYVAQWDIPGLQKFGTLRWSGIVSCLFLILCLLATPLALATKGGFRWLRVNRRYLGVASFCYAVLHLFFWLIWIRDAHFFLRSFIRPEIVTGWIAFFIMIPLAWTSTDAAVRRMGPKWKALQRWVYPAAVLTFLHWITTAESLQRYAEPLVLSAPLIALSVWRFGLRKRNG